MQKKFYLIIIALLVYTAISPIFVHLWAGTTGKIVGTVIDAQTSEGLAGVNVMLEGTTMGAATDLDGYYMILNVPPGIYTIETMMISYQGMRMENVRVSIDLTTKVDFQLKSTILDVAEVITVTAERPLIQKDITSTQVSVGADEIMALPVEEISEVLELQAGMVNGHMRGGRASELAYMIDGVSVTDPYSGDKAVEIENMGIQELQVVSGIFNAEYGQAMSGIVNIVTKEGSKDLSGNLSVSIADYFSQHKGIFYNIDEINALHILDIQASIGGPLPVLKDKFSFFSSARFYDDDGYLYGQRLFNPADNELDPDYKGPTGDKKPVSMNRNKRVVLQGKLTYKISPEVKLSYGITWDRKNYRDFINDDIIHSHSHDFLYNPDGDYQRHIKSYSHSLKLNHILTPTTFYTLNFSHFFHDYRYYVFQDPEEILSGEKIDSRYVDPDLLNINNANFHSGGTEMWHFYRNTTTSIGKFDITSQINKTHQIKSGVELRSHKLYLHEFELIAKKEQGIKIKPFEPDIPPINSPFHNKYTHYPIEASAYIQDKMEFEDIIVNIGFRYDFFEPDGKVPTDLRDPHNESTEIWDYVLDTLITGLDPVRPINDDGSYNYWSYKYRNAKSKHQISPRIGIAFPITEQGVIHFSYGHFFQIPTFEHLYTDPEFEVEKGLKTRMGNADLRPQNTVIYEIGLQQQLSENIGLHVTSFYKDIRDLLGTEIHETYIMGHKYARYVNRDYGNVRGITIAFDKRRSGYLSASIDYTYQVAEGNASDPNASFWDNQSNPPREAEKQVVPLDWDQTHTLNLAVTLSQLNSWGVSIIGRYGSGLPYTPAYQYQRTGVENSERKPANYNIDLKTYKEFQIGKINYKLYLKITNLFDGLNENDVYTDTGRAGYTLTRSTGVVTGPLTYDDYYRRADYYSRPRQVKIGITMGF